MAASSVEFSSFNFYLRFDTNGGRWIVRSPVACSIEPAAPKLASSFAASQVMLYLHFCFHIPDIGDLAMLQASNLRVYSASHDALDFPSTYIQAKTRVCFLALLTGGEVSDEGD